MSNAYELRLYDDTLLTFSLYNEKLKLKAEIISINESKVNLLPFDIDLSGESILKWLKRRVIPKSRRFVNEILEKIGKSPNDVKGIIDVCYGLSLNDSYWVVPVRFSGKFANYNLYENRFSEAMALVAYTGAGESDETNTSSPEYTTNGTLRKAWHYIPNDGIYLYKGGSEGEAISGKEPYSEFYACQIAKAMGLGCIEYDLEYWRGILTSKCKLFTDINTSFVPIGRLINKPDLQKCSDFYTSLGKSFYEDFCSMLVFDALICNEDRHYGNFGLLVDSHSRKIVSTAPLFDNGFSLFNFALEDDIENLQEYSKTRPNPYDMPYDYICLVIMGEKQKEQLRKLKGFTFTRHESINLPEERLIAIENYLQNKVEELLKIPNDRD